MTHAGDDDLLGRLLAGQDPTAAPPTRSAAPDVSVRPAIAEDVPAIGDIHARTMRASLAAGLGADLDDELRAAIDPGELGRVWGQAITDPPSPSHRVLTALAGAEVVGFAAFAPAEVPVPVAADEGPGGRGAEHEVMTAQQDTAVTAAGDEGGAPDAGAGDTAVTAAGDEGGAPDAGAGDTLTTDAVVGEIVALEVPAAHARNGHGSRLLAACADLLREEGVTRVQTWTVRDDESRTRFLSSAGFAPAGLRRSVDVGGTEVVEICWYADL